MMNQSRQLLTLVGFAFCLLTATASHADVNWSMAAPLITSGSRVATVSTWPVTGNANWVQSDIGTIGKAGNAAFAESTFTISGSGEDIWGKVDSYHFVYHPILGDGSIVARVISIQSPVGRSWSKAGVMLREKLEPTSRYAFMLLSANGGASFQRRTDVGKDVIGSDGAKFTPPYWVRLDRHGDTFTAYNSIDGVKWEQVGTETMNIPKLAFVGFAVCSHENGVLMTAKFDKIALSFHQINTAVPELASK